MINITHKANSIRKAMAQALVQVGSPETISAVKDNKIPKGNVLEMARTAGLFAVKRTPDVIPSCHPLPVEYTDIRYRLGKQDITIEVEVHTVYKTGIEVEAMHAAAIVALTIYDMLKPVDREIEIRHIRLLEKRGGRSDHTRVYPGNINEHSNKEYSNHINGPQSNLNASVIICSDSIAAGKSEDTSGKAIREKLESYDIRVMSMAIVPDDIDKIRVKVAEFCRSSDLVITTGGTGLSPRDVTPEAVRTLLEKEIPGITEAIRHYGQCLTPHAMLSREIAGLVGKTLVICLPGSKRAVMESMDAVFPGVLHVFPVMNGLRHDKIIHKK